MQPGSGFGVLMQGSSQWVLSTIGGVFGLLIGSFLNVVIYRLPVLLERQWAAEGLELAGQAVPQHQPFSLTLTRSRCAHCGHQIRWYENIPVLSYVALLGACSQCQTRISVRYPVVEIATGGLFYLCTWRWGATCTTLVWCSFCAALLTLALIDWDTTLLPDNPNVPLLWLGLIAAAMHWTPVSLPFALWGAVAGYLSLWSVNTVFRLIRGVDGMGYGDFKLLAALGAWFGWQVLLPIILIASVIGSIVGITMKFTSGLREGGYMPFGPFLAGAGFVALIVGPDELRRLALLV